MTLFQLIDRWHQRKVLRELIYRHEQLAAKSFISLADTIGSQKLHKWADEDTKALQDMIISEAYILKDRAEFYREQLNKLL